MGTCGTVVVQMSPELLPQLLPQNRAFRSGADHLPAVQGVRKVWGARGAIRRRR